MTNILTVSCIFKNVNNFLSKTKIAVITILSMNHRFPAKVDHKKAQISQSIKPKNRITSKCSWLTRTRSWAEFPFVPSWSTTVHSKSQKNNPSGCIKSTVSSNCLLQRALTNESDMIDGRTLQRRRRRRQLLDERQITTKTCGQARREIAFLSVRCIRSSDSWSMNKLWNCHPQRTCASKSSVVVAAAGGRRNVGKI